MNGRKADSAPDCKRLALLGVLLYQVAGTAMLHWGKCLALWGFAPETNQTDISCSALELKALWVSKKAKRRNADLLDIGEWQTGVSSLSYLLAAMSS